MPEAKKKAVRRFFEAAARGAPEAAAAQSSGQGQAEEPALPEAGAAVTNPAVGVGGAVAEGAQSSALSSRRSAPALVAFLSHFQKNPKDTKSFSFTRSSPFISFKVWLDIVADDLTARSVMEGAANSAHFLLFLNDEAPHPDFRADGSTSCQ